MLTIGFIGNSHLAYCSAIAAAEKGEGNWNIISYATEHKLDSIKEPLFDELKNKNINKLLFSCSLTDIEKCDLVYIAIDVPTDDLGNSDVSSIIQAIALVKKHIKKSGVLIILSQVNPGFTNKISFPKERLFYQVETLIFGKAIVRALNPERYIIGAHNKTRPLPKLYASYLDRFSCPILKMSYESAELAKISINLFLISTVTTTNLLSNICEVIGAEWEDISETLRLDKRIGPYAYLAPGLGISGGNLERDLATIKKIITVKGLDVSYVDSMVNASSKRKNWVLKVFNSLPISEKIKLGVLGLAYKKDTISIKNSPSIHFLKSIPEKLSPIVFDPEVKSVNSLGFLKFAKTQQDVVAQSNVLAILTPWDCFSEIDLSNFNGYIIDPCGMTKKIVTQSKRYILGNSNG